MSRREVFGSFPGGHQAVFPRLSSPFLDFFSARANLLTFRPDERSAFTNAPQRLPKVLRTTNEWYLCTGGGQRACRMPQEIREILPLKSPHDGRFDATFASRDDFAILPIARDDQSCLLSSTHLELMLGDVILVIGSRENLGLVDIVDTGRLEDLRLYKVSYTGFGHHRDRDSVLDLFKKTRNKHMKPLEVP